MKRTAILLLLAGIAVGGCGSAAKPSHSAAPATASSPERTTSSPTATTTTGGAPTGSSYSTLLAACSGIQGDIPKLGEGDLATFGQDLLRLRSVAPAPDQSKLSAALREYEAVLSDASGDSVPSRDAGKLNTVTEAVIGVCASHMPGSD